MFWKFNLISTSHIETLLKNENVTLQELMDEEDILQECKAQNKSLVEFLVHPEIMKEMVDLVISEPSEELDEKFRYKYSNIASELLTSDVPQITESLASDKILLNKLYSFLETDRPLNPLLASFFSKTYGILISRKTEVTFEFLQTKDFVNQIMGHLKTSAIMDLLLRLVTCPENSELRLEILNWLNQQQAIPRLMSLIDPNIDEERHCNASQALCDIIRMARERQQQMQEKLESDPLLQTIESAEAITTLLSHIFNGTKNESALVNGILVLLTLLEVKKPGLNSQQQQVEQSSIYFRPEAQETMTPQDEERIRQGLTRTVSAILPRVRDFHQLLIDPPKKQPISTTFGTLDPPMGSTRIHLARLISAFLFANVHSVNVELNNLGTMQVLLDLFFQYSWNNFLHTQVEQCIGIILSNDPTEDENGKKVHPLLDNLFVNCKLINRILDAWEENDREEVKTGGHRRGYMGHLTNMANHITLNVEKGVNSELIENRLKELPEESKRKWEAFVSGTLADVNKKNLVTPVGAPNLQFSPEDDVEGNSFPHETALQQMQQMTNNFIDQFGFNDDEFGEHEDNVTTPLERPTSVSFNIPAEEDTRRELFERVCNERIQPLDSADSDEDIWDDKEQDIILSTTIEARPGMGTNLAPRTTRVGSDHSTDSEGEDDSKLIPVLSSTPAPSSEDMKMDVDLGDAWNTNTDAVAMDTGNPWESTSQTEPTTTPIASNTQETGWADFGSFSDFSSTANFPSESNSGLPVNSPIAMETSEDANFKIDSSQGTDLFSTQLMTFKEGLVDTCKKRCRPEVDVRQTNLRAGNGDSKLTSTTQSDISNVAEPKNITPLEADCFKSSSSQDTHSLVDKKCEDCKDDTTEIDSSRDLRENFTYLVSSGLIRTIDTQTTSGAHAEKCLRENGPSETSGANREEPRISQAKVDETRAKALDACEQFTVVVGATPNGPV